MRLQPPGVARFWLTRFLLRVLRSAVLTTLLLLIATRALFVTHAARPVSLLLEPLSLLLLPGLVVSLARGGWHDFSPADVLRTAAVFYFLLFCLLPAGRPQTPGPRL